MAPKSFEQALRKLKFIFMRQWSDQITIQRQYLPEIFSNDLIDISENDGLPILKSSLLEYFQKKGIITRISTKEIRFEVLDFEFFDKIERFEKLEKSELELEALKLEEDLSKKGKKKEVNEYRMRGIIALSYFHRKIGPLVFYSYPKNMLEKELSSKVANIMDQQFSEGFFNHSFDNLKSMNYYFEIHSDWVRGKKEMLMVSLIHTRQVPIEIEEHISILFSEFAKQIKSNEEVYMGLYISDINKFEAEVQERIIRNGEIIKQLVNNLYTTINKDISRMV